jgi:hypothetical protein
VDKPEPCGQLQPASSCAPAFCRWSRLGWKLGGRGPHTLPQPHFPLSLACAAATLMDGLGVRPGSVKVGSRGGPGAADVQVWLGCWFCRRVLAGRLTSQGGGVAGFGGWLEVRALTLDRPARGNHACQGVRRAFVGWLLFVGGPLDTHGWALPRPTEGEDTQSRTLLRWRACGLQR